MWGVRFVANDKSLISLALIKTNWENDKKDYMDLFIPFILYSISDLKEGNIVSVTDIGNRLHQNFGIDLYNNVIENFFKRLSSDRHYSKPFLYKNRGVYYRTAEQISIKAFEENRAKYIQNQNDVIDCFVNFLSQKEITFEPETAKKELISYLCKYGYSLLHGNLMIRENTIWTKRIGEFIEWTFESNSNIFNYLIDISKGGMLSTVYLLDKKQIKISQKFKKTEIYFDTPLLMFILNYSGNALQKTVQELVDLLNDNGATVCTFEHNLSELEDILNAYINRYRKGTLNTSYNFDYLIENDVKPEKIESEIPSLRYVLKTKKIYVKDTPDYNDYWRNIGIVNFNNYLSTKIHYNRDDRRDNDVQSIASVYRLRDREIYHNYETCKALFVATNSFLVYHTQKYFKEHEGKKGIPAIVDDTFLTSVLWLKSVHQNDELPTLKLITDALAAQEPSKKFWDNFIEKIDELHARGEITEDEVIELKYGLFSKKNMFDVTEGDSNKITHETVKQVQQMNYRTQHREIIAEKEKVENEKNEALNQLNEYQKKYHDSHAELVRIKSQPYIKQIKTRKRFYNILSLIIVSIIIYFLLDWLTNVLGFISNIKYIINMGATAFIVAIFAIINLFIDKFFTNLADKISIKMMSNFLNNIYNSIYNKENEYASEIVSIIRQTLEKDTD